MSKPHRLQYQLIDYLSFFTSSLATIYTNIEWEQSTPSWDIYFALPFSLIFFMPIYHLISINFFRLFTKKDELL